MRAALGSLASYGTTIGAPSKGEARVSDLFVLFRQRWWMIVLPTLVAFILSFIIVNLLTPRYTAESKIILENRDSYFTRPTGDLRDSAQQLDSEAVQTQIQLVMSRDLAIDAIRRLGLVGNPEFDPLADELGSLRKVLVVLGLSRNPVDKSPEERLLSAYYDSLLVYPAGRSRVLTVEFRSKDADLSARAANTIAELYIEKLETSKKDTARTASAWLANTIDPLRRKLSETEAKIEAYRARNGLLQTGVNNTTIVSQQLTDLSSQLASARVAKAEAEAKARLIRQAIRQGRAFEIPDVANNDLIRRLIEQRVTMRAQLALEMRTLLSEHPRIKELQAQLYNLEDQMRSAAERVVRSLENEAMIVGSRVDSLLNAIETQKAQVVSANESEIELKDYEREAKSQRDQLESYMIKYREALARDAENAVVADARIVSRAIVPMRASFPKKGPTIAVVTLATLFLSIGLLLARHLLSDPYRIGVSQTGYSVPLRQTAPFSSVVQPVTREAAASDTVTRTRHPFDILNRMRRKNASSSSNYKPEDASFDDKNLQTPSPLQSVDHHSAVNTDDEGIAASPFMPVRLREKHDDDTRQDHSKSIDNDQSALHDNNTLDRHPDIEQAIENPFKQTGQLLRYMRRVPIDDGRGRRVLCIFEDNDQAQATVRSVLNELSLEERGIYVQLPPQHAHTYPGPVGSEQSADLEGFTDLVAGDVTFSDVIIADSARAFHWIPAGLGVVDEIVEDTQTLDVVLRALEQTYPWVLCGLPADSAHKVLPTLLTRVDNVVVVISQGQTTPALSAIASELGQTKGGKVVLVRTSEANKEA